MKSSVSLTPKRGEITGQSDQHANVHGNLTPLDPYIGSVGSKTKIYKETHTRHAGQSHLMKITPTSAFPKEGITTHSYTIGAQSKVPLHSSHTS